MLFSPKKAKTRSQWLMTVKAFAPAKINLTLHVVGQRSDGYHLLDSLVVFVDVGDRIIAEKADEFSMSVDGPAANGVPRDEGNLVLRAARLFGEDKSTSLMLTKLLPPSSGIGGGSSDAAATIRAISELHDVPEPDGDIVLRLGSDVPVCLAARPARMQGVGGTLSAITMPALFMVLVNPGVSLTTPKVFSALLRKSNPPMPTVLPAWSNTNEFTQWLAIQRNDLEEPAGSLLPEIHDVLGAIRATANCQLSRMSGSGATCFGLYDNVAAARAAACEIQENHPSWWVEPAGLWNPTS